MRFFIIDQSLYDAGGHNLDYTRHVAQCVTPQGWQTIILAHRNFDTAQTPSDTTLYPVFTQGSREGARLGVRLTASALARLERVARPIGLHDKIARFEPLYPRARQFLNDLLPVLENLRPCPGDKLFFPNPSWADLAILAESLHGSIDLTGVEIHAALRFDPPSTPENIERVKRSLHNVANTKIRLWADTAELSSIYADKFDYEISLLSIPILILNNKTNSNIIKVSFLGESRIDKGFHLLPKFIKEFTGSDQNNRFNFFIQIMNDPNKDLNITKYIQELKDYQNHNYKLYTGAMDYPSYKEALEKSDIILCLHEPEHYRYRSAGIITQAIASGIPIVMREGPCSPRSMVFRNNCQDMVRFCDAYPENIAAAVRSAAEISERHPRRLDCVDVWSAPWKDLKN